MKQLWNKVKAWAVLVALLAVAGYLVYLKIRVSLLETRVEAVQRELTERWVADLDRSNQRLLQKVREGDSVSRAVFQQYNQRQSDELSKRIDKWQQQVQQTRR